MLKVGMFYTKLSTSADVLIIVVKMGCVLLLMALVCVQATGLGVLVVKLYNGT